jgi:hypothetical protein
MRLTLKKIVDTINVHVSQRRFHAVLSDQAALSIETEFKYVYTCQNWWSKRDGSWEQTSQL